jgi:hypothetical protein
MYILAPGIKEDPVRRWALPEQVFFACGACHILAYAFLEAYPKSDFAPVWIKPARGFTGSHIVAVRDDMAFDLIPLPKDVLISERKSLEYDNYDRLWLREPGQYLHNAMPRAQQFLRRFPPPPERH